jgi:ABC-type glycerol-3-phosphate transport system substrate-binding protein
MKGLRLQLSGLVLAMAWALSACAGSETPVPVAASETPTETATPPAATATPQPGQEGTIEIWTAWENDKLTILSEYLAEYQEQYPDIVVILKYFSAEDLLPAFQESYLEGTHPTILIGPSTFGPELKRGNRVVDLTERLPESYQQNLYEYLWTQVRFDEAVVGLPLEQVGNVLIRNRQLMPDRAATVEIMAASSRSITDGLVIGAALDLGFPYASSFMPACEALLADAYYQPAFNTEEGECWMELLSRLNRIGRSSINEDDDYSFFIQDRAAWMIESTRKISHAADEIGENWITVDFWPLYDRTERRLAGYVWTENAFLISGHSLEDTELSWAFLSFLTSEENQGEITDRLGTRQIPVLNSIPLDDLLLRQTVFVLERGVPYPIQVNMDAYAEGLEPEMLDVMRGGDPGLALQRAERNVTRILSRP